MNTPLTFCLEEQFKAIRAMPLGWTGSISKWIAVYRSLTNSKTLALWHLYGRSGEAISYARDHSKILERHGLVQIVFGKEQQRYEMKQDGYASIAWTGR